MRDPDLMQRADRAAIALEQAWERWRAMHGLGAEPLPPVSSYVGYSLEEPWGQPRVVFGLRADEAELLVSLLDGHDCVGAYSEVGTRLDWRLPASGSGQVPARGYIGSLGVPAQAPPPGIDLLSPGPPDAFAVGQLDSEDAIPVGEPADEGERRQVSVREGAVGPSRGRQARAARPERAGSRGPDPADGADAATENDEVGWPAPDADLDPAGPSAGEEPVPPDLLEPDPLEPLPEAPVRSRSDDASSEPSAGASRAAGAGARGPGYRGQRYQGFPPRYDAGPGAEPAAESAAVGNDGDGADVAAEAAPGRRSHAGKGSRSARRRQGG